MVQRPTISLEPRALGYGIMEQTAVRELTDGNARLLGGSSDSAPGGEKVEAILGTVTAVVKGGLTVDIGTRAFMPASRSGTRDAVELEKLVGTEITCRITKLDVADEDVVVDRRVVLEEQARAQTQAAHDAMQASLQVGDVVSGKVRSLMPYGAFVDLGGIDGLLHISDMAYARVAKPEDVLTVGQEIQVKVLKIDHDTKKLSLGLKQLQPEPWATATDRFQAGQRVGREAGAAGHGERARGKRVIGVL